MDKVELGSKTAKNGFLNEDFVIGEFNNWKESEFAPLWLKSMNYILSEIKSVTVQKIKGSFKADIQILVRIKLRNLFDIQNLQVKLVSNSQGFNQIDKRWISKYKELWNFNENIEKILKFYTGELTPYKKCIRDNRRMFLDKMSEKERNLLIEWI